MNRENEISDADMRNVRTFILSLGQHVAPNFGKKIYNNDKREEQLTKLRIDRLTTPKHEHPKNRNPKF